MSSYPEIASADPVSLAMTAGGVVASEACLHAAKYLPAVGRPAFVETAMRLRYGTQAWQSEEVIARAKPVAIS
jgi:hypothetical protein